VVLVELALVQVVLEELALVQVVQLVLVQLEQA